MSSEPTIDADSPALAHAKQIGVDVEDLVIEAVAQLERAAEENAHHDARTIAVLDPRVHADLRFVTPLVERDTVVEIKAALRRTDGVDSPRGRWFFKGREDGQHAALLAENGVYLLAVYDEHHGDRELLAMLVVPASIVDEQLAGRWYPSGRREGAVAKLTWSRLLDPKTVETDGGDSA